MCKRQHDLVIRNYRMLHQNIPQLVNILRPTIDKTPRAWGLCAYGVNNYCLIFNAQGTLLADTLWYKEPGSIFIVIDAYESLTAMSIVFISYDISAI
jgi:hypothetical protein